MQLCYFCNQPVQPAESHCPHCRSPLLLVQRYRLVKTLGQGGFGVVYEAIDTQDNNRRCAVKRVAFASLAEKQQFENEALILKQHAPLFRFVPDLYEFWSDHTHTYMVMECIDGPTLDQTSHPWPSPQVEDFLRVLLSYLSKLHAARTIHRDVKPWNIKLTPHGRYVLLDFGIAKHGHGTLTSARGLGTVNYAPPEQIQGLKTDERSDLYSLAATAYFLLTGQSPTQAQNGGSLPPPHILVPGVSANLEAAILCMLEPEPEKRPQSANNALALLDGSLPTLKIAAPYTDATIPIPVASPVSPVSPPGGPVASRTTVQVPVVSNLPAGVSQSATPASLHGLGPGGVPPMPAGPTAQTVPMASVSSSMPSSIPSSKSSASVASQTSSLRRSPFVLVALLLVATLVIACTGIWWFAPSFSFFQPPTQVVGSGMLVSPTSMRLTRTPLDTTTESQTAIPPMTRTALARARDEAQQINQLWDEYDAAVATQDWATAIRVLGDIIAITGPMPSIQDVPVPPYDSRTTKVSYYRAEARLAYGGALQRAGQLDAAQEHYDAVLDAEGVVESLRQQALDALERLEEARRLWQQVNDAWDRQDWQSALDALRALQRLDGFGDEAHDPQDGLTVARLIELAERYLGNAQPGATISPTRPSLVSTPVVVPTSTPTSDETDTPDETATDTPMPTPVVVEPTQDLTPSPTAVLLPTYARTPTPTPVLLPTFARTPHSTGVATSLPTGVATPVPTGVATPVSSGVVSPQPTSGSSPQPSQTGQVQPSSETAGTSQPATATRVQISPTINMPPSAAPSASPAPTLAPSHVSTTIPTTNNEPTNTPVPYPEPS